MQYRIQFNELLSIIITNDRIIDIIRNQIIFSEKLMAHGSYVFQLGALETQMKHVIMYRIFNSGI